MITGPASYLPTLVEFLAHWGQCDALVPGGVTLAGGIALGLATEQRDLLEDARDRVTDLGVERALAREQLNTRIAALQARMVEFNRRIRADLPGSPFARVLPEAFSVGDAEDAVRDGLRQVSKLWAKVDAIAPTPPGLVLPLRLLGDYTLATFNTDRETLRTAYRELTDAGVELRVAREQRNDLQDRIYDILKNYRLKVPTALPAGHALIDSLPALTPPAGRTPAPVAAQAGWDAGSSQAKVTWAASPDDELKEYQVRGVPGDEYDTDDEAVLATVEPAAAREFFTPFALGSPGLTAGFKVYVVLKTGHERGSETVFVTRPGT